MLAPLIRYFVHYGGHFLVPAFIAKKWYSKKWKKVWWILIATNLVDIDHLLSDPIYDPERLSIGNHLLHSYPAIGFYFSLLFFSKTRLIAIGLLLHMLIDGLDFLWVL